MRSTHRHATSLALATLASAAVLAACGGARTQDELAGAQPVASDGCSRCHGSADNAAPPRSVLGKTDTSEIEVGAHQAHVRDGALRKAIACGECHVVPGKVEDPGHIGGEHAAVVFGALATSGGASPAWDRSQASCASVYCHGATLPGGNNTTPRWVKGSSQVVCGSCHGVPPVDGRHPAVTGGLTACSKCHPETVKPDGTIDVAGGKHVDGEVELSGVGCASCHGDPDRPGSTAAAPPRDAKGNTSTTAIGVGAHQAHLGASRLRGPVACTECHRPPQDLKAHPTGTVTLDFGPLATRGVAAAATRFDAASASCASVYCHGATLSGGSNTRPVWTKVDGTQAACGTCHGIPPATKPDGTPHTASTSCGGCHTGYTATTVDLATHVDGVVETGGMTCTSCHGDASRGANAPAPPMDAKGATATSSPGVGAHQAHLGASRLRGPVACTDCHVVPTSTSHSNGVVDVVFSPAAGGAAARFDPTTLSCASVYCHGATLAGGSNRTPVWNRVDGSQSACGTCHGIPPATKPAGSPHTASTSCGGCHTGYTASSVNIATHMNGKVELGAMSCTSCHGDASRVPVAGADPLVRAAPPLDTRGGNQPSSRGVGAHQAHVNKGGGLARPFQCSTCHAVPTDFAHASQPVNVTFGALPSTGTTAAWNGSTCATYCHGATLRGGSNTSPTWTTVNGTQAACGACHGIPPQTGMHSKHVNERGFSCGVCHGGYGPSTVNASHHVDGAKNVDGSSVRSFDAATQSCQPACHGQKTWTDGSGGWGGR